MSEKHHTDPEAVPRFSAVEQVSELFASLHAGARNSARRRMGPELAGRLISCRG